MGRRNHLIPLNNKNEECINANCSVIMSTHQNNMKDNKKINNNDGGGDDVNDDVDDEDTDDDSYEPTNQHQQCQTAVPHGDQR